LIKELGWETGWEYAPVFDYHAKWRTNGRDIRDHNFHIDRRFLVTDKQGKNPFRRVGVKTYPGSKVRVPPQVWTRDGVTDQNGYNFMSALEDPHVKGRLRKNFQPKCWDKLPVRPGCALRVNYDLLKKDGRNSIHVYLETLSVAGFSDVPFCGSKFDPMMFLSSFRKRLGPLMPAPDEHTLRELGNFVWKFLNDNFTPLEPLTCHDVDELFEEFLAHYSRPEWRKDELRTAYESLRETALNPQDLICKVHIKTECYEGPKFIRFICSRSDRFKARVAGSCHKIEKCVFHGEKTCRFFVKGKPVHLQPSLISELCCNPLFLVSDYTSFESGFSTEYCNAVECQMWRFFLRNNPVLLDDYLSVYFDTSCQGSRLHPKGRTEILKSRYFSGSVQGCRMSGEMWTSLGNGFSNLMNILFLAKKYSMNVQPLVEGDDGLTGVPRDVIDGSSYTKFGFVIKLDKVRDISNTSFCGNYMHKESLRQLIQPEQIMRTFYTMTAGYFHAKPAVKLGILKSKAMSLYYQGRFTPIAQKVSLKLLDILRDAVAVFESSNYWWDEMIRRESTTCAFVPVEITDVDRVHWAKLFGISVERQLEIESVIDAATKLEDLWFPLEHITKRSNDTRCHPCAL